MCHACITYMHHLFNTSQRLTTQPAADLRGVRGLLALCALPHALMACAEGILVAGRDSFFHASSYLVTGVLFIAHQVRHLYNTIFALTYVVCEIVLREDNRRRSFRSLEGPCNFSVASTSHIYDTSQIEVFEIRLIVVKLIYDTYLPIYLK